MLNKVSHFFKFLFKHLSGLFLLIALLILGLRHLNSLTNLDEVFQEAKTDRSIAEIELVDNRNRDVEESVTLDEGQTERLLSSTHFKEAMNIPLQHAQSTSRAYYKFVFHFVEDTETLEVGFTDQDIMINNDAEGYYNIRKEAFDPLVEIFVENYYLSEVEE